MGAFRPPADDPSMKLKAQGLLGGESAQWVRRIRV
jgi:hypothetical protein